jgi:ketosteroid isomerase-like protein
MATRNEMEADTRHGGEHPAATDDRAAEAEREIRQLFELWWRDAAAKDVDAVMAPIASDVVSYEHEAPLEYVGKNAVRAVCQRGFDAMPGQFRWDIPDLHIVVRGDLAVTWGLNRMRAEQAGSPAFESWSRGTRILQKVDGRWQMIHQHVSFPYDPATGSAKTELRPEKPPSPQRLSR